MENYKYFILLTTGFLAYSYTQLVLKIIQVLLLIIILLSIIMGIKFKQLSHEKRTNIYKLLIEFFEGVTINRIEPYKLKNIMEEMFM